MLRRLRQAIHIPRWIFQFTVAGFLFTSHLCAGTTEDYNKIEKISDQITCLDTFESILRKSVEAADSDSFLRAEPLVKKLFAAINFWRENPRGLPEIGWNFYPEFVKAYFLLNGLEDKSNKLFAQGVIPEELNSLFLNEFQYAKPIPFANEDCDPNYLASNLDMNSEEVLNKSHTYFMLEDRQLEALKPILLSLKQDITECIGAPWRVLTIRAWKTPPGAIPSFFGPGWNIESVSPCWSSKGVCDCMDHRAAMIFCSFFNDAFGNPFGGTPCPNPQQAYFGPPVVDIPFLRDLIQNSSPSQIAKELRKKIGLNEPNFHFCHQSAWSREELKDTLNEFGFEVVSFDPETIVRNFGNISGMHEMRDISTFCWAQKRTRN